MYPVLNIQYFLHGCLKTTEIFGLVEKFTAVWLSRVKLQLISFRQCLRFTENVFSYFNPVLVFQKFKKKARTQFPLFLPATRMILAVECVSLKLNTDEAYFHWSGVISNTQQILFREKLNPYNCVLHCQIAHIVLVLLLAFACSSSAKQKRKVKLNWALLHGW